MPELLKELNMQKLEILRGRGGIEKFSFASGEFVIMSLHRWLYFLD